MLAKGQPVPIPAGADDEPFSILADDGTIKPGVRAPEIPDEVALKLYRGMLPGAARRRPHDEAAAPGPHRLLHASLGEEATHFGGAFALRPSDWIFPSLPRARRRVLARLPLKRLRRPAVRQRRRSGQGPADAGAPLGQAGSTIVSISSPVGTQITQAVGLAMGARNIQEGRRARSSTSARARRSTGEFHDGAELRGRVQGAVHLLLPQQRLGDQRRRPSGRRRRSRSP